jgi:monomeric sarcosine oxidase
MAYFEHPDYVPLLRRAYELWDELEQAAGERLFERVGLLQIGPPEGLVISGVVASAEQHRLEIEQLDERSLRSRFPGFRLLPGNVAVFERNAGFLFVERCVLAQLSQARKLGVELRVGESVQGYSADGRSVRVQTDRGEYQAGNLVLTAGAWTSQFLGDLGIRLEVRRKHLHWYRTHSDDYLASGGSPTFLYDTPHGCYYGFPQLDDRGVKVAEHTGGTVIQDPLVDDRAIEPMDRQRVETFLAAHMPGVSQKPADHVVCYYTMSPDEHFIVDRHPTHDNVVFVAGLSGHGFKFTSVLGEIMAEMASSGRTSQPIGFLNCRRWS